MTTPDTLILANLIAARAAADPDVPALGFEHEGMVTWRTAGQLRDNGQRIAAALAARGMGKGDRFAILLQNHPEFVETMIASSILGTVFVPIDPRAGGEKLAYMLRDSGCAGVVAAGYSIPGVRAAAAAGAGLLWILAIDGEDDEGADPALPLHPLAPVLAGPVPQPPLPVAALDPAEAMQVMYTSGTTGDPKGIVIPHARFGAVSHHGEAVFGYRADDRPYTGLSLTHGNAQFVTLAPSLRMGLPAIFSRRFTKSRLWAICRAEGCTTFSILGGMATAIAAEPPRADDADNPVRLVISAGMPAALWEEFERRFGVRLFEFYGAVDGGMAFKRVGEGPIGSCGRAAPGMIARIVDEAGDEVPRGIAGEIWFTLEQGGFPPITYVNNPQASAAKVIDGWCRSGDIGRMDEEGWLFFAHRAGGGIRRNGEFVNPAEVEKAIGSHPDVDDVHVWGLPLADGAPGEKEVVASIVPRDGAVIDPAAIRTWAAARTDRNSVPGHVHVVAEIPKTASEKPQERFLLESFLNRATPANGAS